ncbi:hypothetical protein CS063_08730 [Sporanaerobium hydrogeniformans]|uniref:Uncharacterized protein n=1 Tax=Sporanaerobium hydrogeniformans TaxID=3072179 RepID=A0AC61DDJ1_9FIRM|nr:hypothetical protein [Sporanaerobium hydrogeniformans]PHV70838.1 hypothetical protein CS063_08730 [Sporanaerobium hydrogeniformans]
MSFQDIVKQFVTDITYEAAQQKGKKKSRSPRAFWGEFTQGLDEMETYLQEKTKPFHSSSKR